LKGATSVALIIPTVSHRSVLFARTLRYLSEIQYGGEIVVSDHSFPRDPASISEIAGQHGSLRLKVLKHAPDAHFLERLVLCAKQAQSKYVHLHADDDFLIMDALDSLVTEMERTPNAAAAMGININLSLEDRQFRAIAKGGITQSDAFERLIAQLENYSSVLYALRRRSEFIETLSYSHPRCPDVQFWQYLESCVAAMKGPILVTDELHYVRSLHRDKWSATLAREKSRDHFPYLILSDQFHPRLVAFRAALVEACGYASANVDEGVLDGALIHLLFRGVRAMGLPLRHTPERSTSHQEIIEAQLRDPRLPITAHLLRICELSKQYPLPQH
jgi:glycosyltransferase domain-containing protein